MIDETRVVVLAMLTEDLFGAKKKKIIWISRSTCITASTEIPRSWRHEEVDLKHQNQTGVWLVEHPNRV